MPMIEKIYELAPNNVKNLMDRMMPSRHLAGSLAEANAAMAAERGNYEPWDKLHPGEAEKLSVKESRSFEELINAYASEQAINISRVINDHVGKPIPNPTLDRDADQPRLKL